MCDFKGLGFDGHLVGLPRLYTPYWFIGKGMVYYTLILCACLVVAYPPNKLFSCQNDLSVSHINYFLSMLKTWVCDYFSLLIECLGKTAGPL